MANSCLVILVGLCALQYVFAAPSPQHHHGGVVATEVAQTPQQVKILKQINNLNDDGSYTFGYESADGSFKIETRDNLGNVKGKFGFLDAGGQLKTVEYTAGNGTGFEAQGDYLPPGIPGGSHAAPPARAPARSHYAPAPQHYSPAPQHYSAPQHNFIPAPAPKAKAAPVHYSQPQQQSSPIFYDFGGQDSPSRGVNYELDGFSEDVDQDGFVDPFPAGAISSKPAPKAVPTYHHNPSPAYHSIPSPQYHHAPAPTPRYHHAPAPAPQYQRAQEYHHSPAPVPQYHHAPAPAPSPISIHQGQGHHHARTPVEYSFGDHDQPTQYIPTNYANLGSHNSRPVEVQVFPGPAPKPVQPIHQQAPTHHVPVLQAPSQPVAVFRQQQHQPQASYPPNHGFFGAGRAAAPQQQRPQQISFDFDAALRSFS